MLFTFDNLYRHYLHCRQHKRNTCNALRFEARQELNLLELAAALQDRSYRPSPSVCFVTQRPKLREIFAADFRDRIVHHVLVDYLQRYWEPVFIHDSYACRSGKGIHRAVARLQQFMRQASHNGQRRVYYLQLDIHNYFMRIDKPILYSLLKPHIDDLDALWLTKLLVFHDCTEQFVYKGSPGLLEQLPPHKSLLQAEPGKGLPIGNLNSQFFANVYLNGLDQFVKHQLKCQFFLRYCDDFVLLSEDPEQLRAWRSDIEAFLVERLALNLNPKRQLLRPISDGVDFLGYIVRRDYCLTRRRVINNLRAKLQAFERQLVEVHGEVVMYHFDMPLLQQCRASLASYWGHFKHAHHWRLRQRLLTEFAFLRHYFAFADDGTILPRYTSLSGAHSASAQFQRYTQQFPDAVLLFQVGRFYEFYHPADDALLRGLGLQAMRANRRAARFGFPMQRLPYYQQRLLEQKCTLLLIHETGEMGMHVKQRLPVRRIGPNTGTVK